MKRKINIQNTFQILRNLPLAVSYEQVESWISKSEKQTQVNNRNWWQQLLNRFSNN